MASWGQGGHARLSGHSGLRRPGGGGSCLFRIHMDGKKNEHLRALDQKVYQPDATVDQAEYSGLLAGSSSFVNLFVLGQLTPAPGMLLVEGDSKFIQVAVAHLLKSRYIPL